MAKKTDRTTKKRWTVDESIQTGVFPHAPLYGLRLVGKRYPYVSPTKKQMRWLAARINDGTIVLPEDEEEGGAS